MAQTTGYFHLHLISDSTGETLITVARAAAAQYSRIMPVEHVHPLVRTQKQLDRVLNEIGEMPHTRTSLPLDPGAGSASFSGLSRCRIDPQGRRAAHAECGIFPPHRCAQLHDDA